MPTDDLTKCQIGNFNVCFAENAERSRSRYGLSERETEVLFWFCKGATAREVASALEVTPHTIDTYRRRIFDKLGVNSIASAAVLATAWAMGADVTPASDMHGTA